MCRANVSKRKDTAAHYAYSLHVLAYAKCSYVWRCNNTAKSNPAIEKQLASAYVPRLAS
jgi:hypothetical protein